MITKIIPEEKIIAVLKLINKAKNIVIVSHKRPDGDAIGSSLGLYHFLATKGKDVSVILPDAIPGYMYALPSADGIVFYDNQMTKAQELINRCDLLFCLDFNTLDRIGKLSASVNESKAKKILMDHHLHHDEFCDVIISHPEVSSASELVFRLICRMGYFADMTLESAQCICAGMMTDTGGLAYNANSPEVYAIMEELIKKGVDKDALYRKLFNNYSENRMRLMGYMLYEKMKIYPEYHTAILTLSYNEMLKFNYKPGDSEGFVNIPLSIDHVFCSIFIKEEKECMKLSFRSQGDFDVNKMANELFGGGGHKNASGADYKGTMADALKIVEDALPKYI
ncbi:MAG: bifunctional oligoribonuclease/PAP phosphatase NrnA [Paludibacteraceae bacterium]|nr:bifunctional oligoribonuclease/PAP phosphatase NrnA [Paludibacteraceae bacterium]